MDKIIKSKTFSITIYVKLFESGWRVIVVVVIKLCFFFYLILMYICMKNYEFQNVKKKHMFWVTEFKLPHLGQVAEKLAYFTIADGIPEPHI